MSVMDEYIQTLDKGEQEEIKGQSALSLELEAMESLESNDDRLRYYRENIVHLLIGLDAIEKAMQVKRIAKTLNVKISEVYADMREQYPEYFPTEEPDEKTVADILLDLMIANTKEMFTNAVDTAYAVCIIGGIKQTHSITGSTFRKFLSGLYYQEKGKAPPVDAVRQVVAVAEARPLFEGWKGQTALRVERLDNGVIAYDLANDNWESVAITADGWGIHPSPKGMIRAANTQAQVTPLPGGEIERLRPFLNVKSDSEFRLIVIWLAYIIAAPYLPKPIIALHGSKGAGKSTFQRVLRRLVDPAAAELTGLPGNEVEMAVQAEKNYLLSFDNLSKISPAQSDLLCTIATGGALSKRKLYTDNEEVIMRFSRPVTLSSIGGVAQRTDLLDRCIMIELQRIPKSEKQTEQKFWDKFETEKPYVLGALFTAISKAMAAPDVDLPELERMADFTEMGYKLAVALGFDGNEFIAALHNNEGQTLDAALKESPVATTLMALIETNEYITEFINWDEKEVNGDMVVIKLTSSRLHQVLNSVAYKLRLGKDFPKSSFVLTKELKPLITDLRAVGIVVEETANKKTKQTSFHIYTESDTLQVAKMPPLPPLHPQASNYKGLDGGGRENFASASASAMPPPASAKPLSLFGRSEAERDENLPPPVPPPHEASNYKGRGGSGASGGKNTTTEISNAYIYEVAATMNVEEGEF